MKAKILLAAVVASLVVLPWMAFTGDLRDSAASPHEYRPPEATCWSWLWNC